MSARTVFAFISGALAACLGASVWLYLIAGSDDRTVPQ